MRGMAEANVPVPAAVRQPPGAVRTYAAELLALARWLDPSSGWFAVFAEHDPHGLQECLSGREMPPWDVVASLLEDLRQLHGPGAALQTEERLRPLHGAAVAAYDVHAGGEPVLRERLAAAAGELDEAAARVRALEAGGAAAYGAEAGWAQDYLERVEGRCAELRARLAALEAASARAVRAEQARTAEQATAAEQTGIVRQTGTAEGDASAAAPPPPKRRARRGGSRFAGAADDAAEAAAAPAPIVPPGAPSADLAPRTGGAGAGAGPGTGTAANAEPPGELAPRGARFAGATRGAPARTAPGPLEIAEARAVAEEAAVRLARLRRAGSGGEAHALLSDAACWPPVRFAVLVGELQRHGLEADADTLLWEAAALPTDAFAAAADALSALGRGADSARLLRQGVSRPPQQIADAALALHRAGRDPEAAELLGAVIRSRTPAGAAQVARAEPAVLVGLVLEAARALSQEQFRRVADALRTAGVPGVPKAL
jgi:hypothetical protein